MWWTAGTWKEIRVCPFPWLQTSAWNHSGRVWRWKRQRRKKLSTTFSTTYSLLRCYFVTSRFFTIEKTCTRKQQHELWSPVSRSYCTLRQTPACQQIYSKVSIFDLGAFTFLNQCPPFENQTCPGHVWGHSDMNHNSNSKLDSVVLMWNIK